MHEADVGDPSLSMEVTKALFIQREVLNKAFDRLWERLPRTTAEDRPSSSSSRFGTNAAEI